MQNKITVIDYGMGNLRSVEKNFLKIGADVEITSNLKVINDAKKIVLPGVGHFANGVMKLKESGIWDILNKRVINDKIPILGICLGMQLMARRSEEGSVDGFGWFDAKVVRFKIKDQLKFKVPHMGWNNVTVKKSSHLFQGISDEMMFYFVHSYYIQCNNSEDILSISEYENQFTSAIQKKNIFGTQFHPEKSHEWGEVIFKNFLRI